MQKGLTLIELLGVIVVLGFIFLIAMPIVLNYVNESRKASFELSMSSLVRTAENECLRRRAERDREAVVYSFEDGHQSVSPEKEKLQFSGRAPTSGSIFTNEHCEIAIAVHDESWCAIKEYGDNEIVFIEYEEGECYLPPSTPEEFVAAGYIPISTPDELNNIRHGTENTFGSGTEWEGTYTGGLDKKYFQTNDIDLDVAPYNAGNGWEPLGRENEEDFTGIYCGLNYSIENLFIEYLNVDWDEDIELGLFYKIGPSGIVRDLNLDNIYIHATFYVGGLSTENYGLIENVNLSGTITLIGNGGGYVGGLVYLNKEEGIIKDVSVDLILTPHATSSWAVGGIVGNNLGEIIRARAQGVIDYPNGTTLGVAGIAGWNSGSIRESFSNIGVTNRQYYYISSLAGWCSDGTIENSYATGDIEVRYESGGFCGASSNITIINSYSIGEVLYGPSGDPSTVGGFIGIDYGDTTITNSYWNTQTSGQSTSAGGEGRTTADMTYPYNSSNTYIDWDFDNIWAIDPAINDGYPYLIHNPPFE